MTKEPDTPVTAPSESGSSVTDPLDLVRRALASLKYGEILIAVHDGQIVQIARTEKIRPQSSRSAHPSVEKKPRP